jgi:hypothetical protein
MARKAGLGVCALSNRPSHRYLARDGPRLLGSGRDRPRRPHELARCRRVGETPPSWHVAQRSGQRARVKPFPPPAAALLYDAACGFCRRAVARILALGPAPLPAAGRAAGPGGGRAPAGNGRGAEDGLLAPRRFGRERLLRRSGPSSSHATPTRREPDRKRRGKVPASD